jgi:tRNA/tmRNA/rRNA uracil-C5-methylase (TrmA/RlmC/RlmD family)
VADPVTPAGPWEYRARAQFKVSGTPRSIGFHQRETNRVVDINRCPLLDRRVNDILAILRAMKHPPLSRLFPGLREVCMALGTGTGKAVVSLFAGVRERAAIRLLDLYCGVGMFTVPLSRRAREVVGVEASAVAATDGVHNLLSNGCSGAQIVQAQVEQVLPTPLAGGPWNLVVLDPPRQGVSRQILDAIVGAAVPRVIYVSCDPSTLARDLGILTRAGFRCVTLHPIDLFPQTFHMETVGLLERAPA